MSRCSNALMDMSRWISYWSSIIFLFSSRGLDRYLITNAFLTPLPFTWSFLRSPKCIGAMTFITFNNWCGVIAIITIRRNLCKIYHLDTGSLPVLSNEKTSSFLKVIFLSTDYRTILKCTTLNTLTLKMYNCLDFTKYLLSIRNKIATYILPNT